MLSVWDSELVVNTFQVQACYPGHSPQLSRFLSVWDSELVANTFKVQARCDRHSPQLSGLSD